MIAIVNSAESALIDPRMPPPPPPRRPTAVGMAEPFEDLFAYLDRLTVVELVATTRRIHARMAGRSAS